MATWIFEPGHTEAEFRARHFEGEIDATRIWTGEPDRDAHLRSADFFVQGRCRAHDQYYRTTEDAQAKPYRCRASFSMYE